MTPEDAQKLREPFPPEVIGQLPKGGVMLDYVGHAAVTHRLLQVDPAWTWEPLALSPEGLPALDRVGNLWIKLTCAGVTRIGVGDGKNAKECISDAIRNAAMRFGVALDLWAKEDLQALRNGGALTEPGGHGAQGDPATSGGRAGPTHETPPGSANVSDSTGEPMEMVSTGTAPVFTPAVGPQPEQASPVEDDGKFPPPGVPEGIRTAQVKKLNVLVGTLRDAGLIKTEQLWKAVRPGQEWPRDMDGELHWAPLRDSLTKDEASSLIDRLEKKERGTDYAALAAQAQAKRAEAEG